MYTKHYGVRTYIEDPSSSLVAWGLLPSLQWRKMFLFLRTLLLRRQCAYSVFFTPKKFGNHSNGITNYWVRRLIKCEHNRTFAIVNQGLKVDWPLFAADCIRVLCSEKWWKVRPTIKCGLQSIVQSEKALYLPIYQPKLPNIFLSGLFWWKIWF